MLVPLFLYISTFVIVFFCIQFRILASMLFHALRVRRVISLLPSLIEGQTMLLLGDFLFSSKRMDMVVVSCGLTVPFHHKLRWTFATKVVRQCSWPVVLKFEVSKNWDAVKTLDENPTPSQTPPPFTVETNMFPERLRLDADSGLFMCIRVFASLHIRVFA